MATAEDNPTLRLATSVYDGGDLARVRFVARVAERGFTHLAHDWCRGAVDAASIADLGVPELVRTNARGGELEALLWLDDGAPCLLNETDGVITIEVAGDDAATLAAAVARVRDRLHQEEGPPSSLQFRFWSASAKGGGDVRYRDLDVTTWAAARANYTAPVARALDAAMTVREPRRGRLMIWRGAPGTGKTWALRALADAWRDWCPPHYILDPHRLMSADPRYLLDVLSWNDVGKWTIVLVTTNEPVEHLHPAVRRRGRCLADIEFEPLSRTEAREWLRRAGSDHEPDGPLTLAELYAVGEGGEAADEPLPAATRFGFSRVLGR